MGRLNGVKGWCQKTTAIIDDYIQVNTGALHTVCAIATQGKKNGSFVKSYKLSFSYDESSWSVYQEQNIDKVWNNSTLIFSGPFNLFVWCANHPYKMNLWQSHVSFRFINCAKKSSLMLLKMIIKYLQSYSTGRNTYQSYHGNNTQCYISQLVCALWSVN